MRDFRALYQQLSKADQPRQQHNALVTHVRRGDLNAVMPGGFPESWPAPVTANLIDNAAQDIGEVVGELPTIRCRPDGSSRRQAEGATLRTKIALGYVEQSGLQRHMYAACDRLVTFGTMPIVVEPDFDINGPVLRLGDSRRSVYRKNLRGDVTDYFEYWDEPRSSLEAKYPHVNLRVQTNVFQQRRADSEADPLLTVVRYYGPGIMVLFVPDRDNAILSMVETPVKRTPVAVVELPVWDEELHGSYENAVWVQLARARMALYTMEAVDKSLNAPLAVPPDVTKVPYGPNSLLRSSDPSAIRRVALDVPREAWAQAGSLEREERTAARYPEGRSGNIDASVITGQGVNALLGTIDSRVKTLQTLIAFELKRAVGLAFELDEKLFGGETKTVAGTLNGKKFETRYQPSKAIAGNYSVDITYGFMSGMDPNRATVMMLQLLGAGLVDKTTVQEQLPFQIDVDDVNERLDREAIEAALRAGIQSMLSNVGMMASTGQDPTALLTKAAALVDQREKGKSLAEAMLDVFKVEEQPQADPFSQAQEAMTPGTPPGMEEPPQVQTPGQPGGGRLMQMLASLSSSGQPSMSTRIAQQTTAA